MTARPRLTGVLPDETAALCSPVDLPAPDAAAVATAFAFAHHQLAEYLMANRDRACVLCGHSWGVHIYQFLQDGFKCAMCSCLSKDQQL